jgi:hypothetical protein
MDLYHDLYYVINFTSSRNHAGSFEPAVFPNERIAGAAASKAFNCRRSDDNQPRSNLTPLNGERRGTRLD